MSQSEVLICIVAAVDMDFVEWDYMVDNGVYSKGSLKWDCIILLVLLSLWSGVVLLMCVMHQWYWRFWDRMILSWSEI